MKVLRTQMPLTCCFWTLRLTVVRSLPKSSDVMTCDSSASIQPSTSSQLCLKRTERFASNNFSPLALVISSSSSHCSFRFFRIGSSWSLHSGFSRISASPSWNSATHVFNNSAKIHTQVITQHNVLSCNHSLLQYNDKLESHILIVTTFRLSHDVNMKDFPRNGYLWP